MVSPAISIVTPTHDRQLLFSLTERWLKPALEKYDGEVQWIVADDGTEETPLTLGQARVSSDTPGEVGISSFLGNMRRGLEAVKNDYVIIIEDDDWHHPDYLNKVMSLFTEPKIGIVGEAAARYYHMPSMSYYTHRNMIHASWCQTAFRSEFVPKVLDVISHCTTYLLDMQVWAHLTKITNRNIAIKQGWTIGIKGLSLDAALGAGHNTRMYHSKDPYGHVLRAWIGDEAANVYFDLIRARAQLPMPTAIKEPDRRATKRWRHA